MRRLFGRAVLIAVVVFGIWYVVGHYTGTSTFGCQASGPVAHADNSDCPGSINAAADDAQWAAARLADIPRVGTTTTGLFYDVDGHETRYTSHEDSAAAHAADVLRQVGAPPSPIGTYPAASHVEVKAAVGMRDAAETRGVMVINNPGGPCLGDLGCSAALPRVLPAGAVMVVWWRNNTGTMRSQTFTGGAQ